MEYDYIEQGDCLELMKGIPDGSVDLILCDLPYGTTRNSWDAVIPFDKLWEQYHRVAKENAAFVLHCQQPFTARLITSNEKEFKYCWCWHKKQCSGFLNAKKQPLRNYEDIAVFYRKQCTYNPQMRKGKPQLKNTGGQTSNYGKFTSQPHFSDEYYPTATLDFSLPRFRGGHPTQKPVALLEYLIKTYTNPGEVVLDNCMGSGSTCVAAVNTGRHYIGFELDPTYFDMACKRLDEAERKVAEHESV